MCSGCWGSSSSNSESTPAQVAKTVAPAPVAPATPAPKPVATPVAPATPAPTDSLAYVPTYFSPFSKGLVNGDNGNRAKACLANIPDCTILEFTVNANRFIDRFDGKLHPDDALVNLIAGAVYQEANTYPDKTWIHVVLKSDSTDVDRYGNTLAARELGGFDVTDLNEVRKYQSATYYLNDSMIKMMDYDTPLVVIGLQYTTWLKFTANGADEERNELRKEASDS